jgi:SET domain-containing protein
MPRTENAKLPIEVRDSTIHGSGAFATKVLRKGRFIGRYTGRRLSAEEVAERDWDHALTFVFGMADGSVIDGAQGGNATRHINHSCAPNCVAFEIEPETGENWIEIEALTRIEPGDELFLDYSLDPGAGEPADFRCLCGAASCRGTLVAPAPA